MCTMGQCQQSIGNWVQFRTPWGNHQGIVESVNARAVLVRMPRQFAPSRLASGHLSGNSDEERLDVALAAYGYHGVGYPGYRAWGYPGYGIWRGGWWWWWLAFAWVFALAFLW